MNQKLPIKGQGDAESTEMEAAEVVGALGRRIAGARKEKGWTRVELAGKLGISRERLAKWELGDNAPPVGILIRLRRVLGVTLDELVVGEPPAGKAMTDEDRRELTACMERLARLLEVPMRTQDDRGWGPREMEE